MKKNNKKGFTLVELVIVVAVMAILVAIAIPTVGSITAKAKTAVYQSNCNTIQSMIKLAEANAANDSATNTVTVGADFIAKALNDAKLGIKASSAADTQATFYYHAGTGAVDNSSAKVTTEGVTDTVFTIKFDTNGVVTCTAPTT